MATFDAVINGQTKKVRLIVLHGKSSSDAESYNRRVYDAQVLKDSIDAFYRNDKVIILGDYNDRLIGSIFRGATVSPYQPFVSDTAGYSPLTYPLDSAGRVSFISGSGLIDHIVITKTLLPEYIAGSTDIEDPRNYITGYNDSTASDHLPVFSRFAFEAPVGPITIEAAVNGAQVQVSWSTAAGNTQFIVERSADGSQFQSIGQVNSTGNGSNVVAYNFTDAQPLPGTSYYRLQAIKGETVTYSNIDTVIIVSHPKPELTMWPNPVRSFAFFTIPGAGVKKFRMQVANSLGNTVMLATGNLLELNLVFNLQLWKLKPGMYVMNLDTKTEHYSVKFIKL
jgi:trimeric autotransporter adhesin